MDLLNFFQFLQALLAIFVVLCLCTKGPVKHHCHVALVVLVISMMIIPPFGRNFLSGASMKEGATAVKDIDKVPTRPTGKTLSPAEAKKVEEMHEQACRLAKMTIGELGQLANMTEGNINRLPQNERHLIKILFQQDENLKKMTVFDLYQTLKLFKIEDCNINYTIPPALIPINTGGFVEVSKDNH